MFKIHRFTDSQMDRPSLAACARSELPKNRKTSYAIFLVAWMCGVVTFTLSYERCLRIMALTRPAERPIDRDWDLVR